MKHLKIAATADGGLIIEGYGVPFGGPIKGKDLHGQYFSKNTDFALDLIPDGQRPLLFQHGLDSAVDTAVIGRWGVKKIDDGGVWVRAQLDARSEYINEIKELVNQDALGFSSGTMGHLVKVSSKSGEILKWALVELSLTPNPANPNAYIVRANKSAAAHVKSLFATKHGDHDQSEHGNRDGAGAGDKGKPSDTGKKKPYSAPVNVAPSGNQRTDYDFDAVRVVDKVMDMGFSGTGGAKDMYKEYARALGRLVYEEDYKRAVDFAEDAAKEARQMGHEKAYEAFNKVAESARAAGNNGKPIVRDLTKTRGGIRMLKVKRTVKHGDHDQSEHGAWASGGGAGDKETSEREKTGDEKGYNGWTNHSTWNMNLMVGDGMFEDDLVKEALADNNGDADGAARDLGLTIRSSVEEDFDANGLNSELANGVISGVVERMDWDAIADNYIEEVGGESTWKGSDSFRSGDEEEHNGWTNRATWLGSLHIDNSGVMGGSDSIRDIAKEAFDAAGGDSEKARYELGRILSNDMQTQLEMTQGESNGGASNSFVVDLFNQGLDGVNWSEIASHTVDAYNEPKKTFRVKRSTKHGDHDQSDHAPGGSGAGRDKEDEESRGARLTNETEENRRDDPRYQEKFGNKGVSEETQNDIDTLAEEVKDLDSSFEDLNDVRGFGITVGGEEMGILEFNTSEGTQGGTNYFMTENTYNNDIEGVPGPEHAFVTLSEDETYDAMDSQELKDYLAAKLSGAPDDEVATAYDKLVRLADKNYKEANDTDEGVLGLD